MHFVVFRTITDCVDAQHINLDLWYASNAKPNALLLSDLPQRSLVGISKMNRLR